jgi:hypothetical protein
VQGASLDLAKPVKVTLDSKINETGSLALDGELTPRPLAATVKGEAGRHRPHGGATLYRAAHRNDSA